MSVSNLSLYIIHAFIVAKSGMLKKYGLAIIWRKIVRNVLEPFGLKHRHLLSRIQQLLESRFRYLIHPNFHPMNQSTFF